MSFLTFAYRSGTTNSLRRLTPSVAALCSLNSRYASTNVPSSSKTSTPVPVPDPKSSDPSTEEKPEPDFTNCEGLKQFFEPPSQWNENTVITGRPWGLKDLRMRSNIELHSLWYVLLKERNMLMTLEARFEEEKEPMTGPERMFKVEESMENLETVVKERNRAFLSLETGADGRRPTRQATTILGFKDERHLDETPDPVRPPPEHKFKLRFKKWWTELKYQRDVQNYGWMDDVEVPYLDPDAHHFQKYWKEKEHMDAREAEDKRKLEAGEHKLWQKW